MARFSKGSVLLLTALIIFRDADGNEVPPLTGSINVSSSDNAVADVAVDNYDGGSQLSLKVTVGPKVGATLITVSGQSEDGSPFEFSGTVSQTNADIVGGTIEFTAVELEPKHPIDPLGPVSSRPDSNIPFPDVEAAAPLAPANVPADAPHIEES